MVEVLSFNSVMLDLKLQILHAAFRQLNAVLIIMDELCVKQDKLRDIKANNHHS